MPGKKRGSSGKQSMSNYCHFWLRFAGRCQYLRVDIDPVIFSSVESLKRHISNHFQLNDLPNFIIIDDTGRYFLLEDLSVLQNNAMIFVQPIGVKLDSIFPDFSVVLSDPPMDPKPKKYTTPKLIQVVRTMLENFQGVLHAIERINAHMHKKSESSDKRLREYFTVQSLFTDEGCLSSVFVTVAKRMNIEIPENTELGPPIRNR